MYAPCSIRLALAPIEAGFDVPKAAPRAATRIEQVYPSTDTLPANTLKLYIYFSAPMRRGEAWQHIRLLDEHGAPVELPFLEIDQELWDPTNTRLTVLFDPGRIKRGLVPLQRIGTEYSGRAALYAFHFARVAGCQRSASGCCVQQAVPCSGR